MKSARRKAIVGKVIVYVILFLLAAFMIVPFLWMLSSSIKSESFCMDSEKSSLE